MEKNDSVRREQPGDAQAHIMNLLYKAAAELVELAEAASSDILG